MGTKDVTQTPGRLGPPIVTIYEGGLKVDGTNGQLVPMSAIPTIKQPHATILVGLPIRR